MYKCWDLRNETTIIPAATKKIVPGKRKGGKQTRRRLGEEAGIDWPAEEDAASGKKTGGTVNKTALGFSFESRITRFVQKIIAKDLTYTYGGL